MGFSQSQYNVVSIGWFNRVATVGMEIEHNNKWVCMKRTDDNYFNIDGLGEIKFPKKFRITSISNEQLVTTLPGIKSDENIPTDIQYSGFKPGMAFGKKFCTMRKKKFQSLLQYGLW